MRTIINKGDTLKRLFPQSLTLKKIVSGGGGGDLIGGDGEDETIILADELPCSVKHLTTTDGEVLLNTFQILCPCIDFGTGGTQASEGVSFELSCTINGRAYVADEVLSIDNMDIYQLGDLHIGCKIICKANENWVC